MIGREPEAKAALPGFASKAAALGGVALLLVRSAAAQPAIEIANPEATFPAQQRALPPADVIERGDGLYQVNCMACHGSDLRGGDQGGSNLLRSDVVLNDVSGELIGDIIRSGMNRMPPIATLGDDDITAIAGFIHSVVATAERQGAPPRVDYDLDIVVGDPRRGERFFEAECAGCHSTDGDLKDLASEIGDPVDLQNSWVAGRRFGRTGAGRESPPVTVTVSVPGEGTVAGELIRYDDFFVSLRTAAGAYRSFSRVDSAVDVEVSDPLAAHQALWAAIDDETMHDVTAYLEGLR